MRGVLVITFTLCFIYILWGGATVLRDIRGLAHRQVIAMAAHIGDMMLTEWVLGRVGDGASG